jgi:DNA polymerase III epsilon subunit-like protein
MEPDVLDVLAQRPSLSDITVAVIDVETSGLSPEHHHLLQVAVVVVDATGRERHRWSSDIRPPRGLFGDVGPREIHGLTRRRLWRAPRVGDVLEALQPLLANAVIAGHNVHFDLAFLDEASRQCGIPLPTTTSLCTLELSRRLDPQRQRRHRLGDLCQFYGIALDRPHDALADAEATAALLSHLLREFHVREPSQFAALVRSNQSLS